MSIYDRRKTFLDFEQVDRRRAPRPAKEPAPVAPAQQEEDWSLHRRSQPAEHLLAMGERWLDTLPIEITPAALVTQFPRIVNLLALQWGDRRRCPAYFDELLTDRRGGRRGFPPQVQQELVALREYWYTRALTLQP